MTRAEALASLKLTYTEVGATRGQLPPGYRHLRHVKLLGHGKDVYERALESLLTWQLHRRVGLRVEASSCRVSEGVDAMLTLPVGPIRFQAPVRVVYTTAESHRGGFAYGTLEGHPEVGEESFMIVREQDGGVRVMITAFSRPATWWSRAGKPVASFVQRRVTSRYLSALVEHQLPGPPAAW